MESRWYLKRGQTLENTKIEDRKHALHVGRTAWGEFQKHLDRNKLMEEARQEEANYKKRMKEGSDNMTKNWDNSVENIRKRKEAERNERLEVKEDIKMKNYLELRKLQDQIRDKYVEDKRKAVYRSTQYPKELNGALLLSEVIYEREKQKEFEEFLLEHERKEEEKYVAKIRQGALDELRENEEKERARKEKMRNHHSLFLKDMSEKLEKKKKEDEEQLAEDASNIIHAQREIEKEAKIVKEEQIKKSQAVRDQMLEEIAIKKRRQEYIKKEDIEVDEVINIYEETKNRITCLRKLRDVELRSETIEKRIKAGEGARLEKKQREEAFEKSLAAAVKEKLDKEEEIRLEKAAKVQKMREEIEEDRIEHLAKERTRLAKEDEVKRWEMLNRFKQLEVMKEYDEEQKKKRWKNVLIYREELMDQMKYDKELVAKSDINIANIGAAQNKEIEENDKRFFDYAKEVLDLAKSKGRNTIPIEKVILKYTKECQGRGPKKTHKCIDYMTGANPDNMVNTQPGKMQHDPKTDPGYHRCKCQKERLYR